MTSVILAGGENNRYPTPKAFIEVDGVPIISRTLDILRKAAGPDVVISTNEPDLYSHLGVPLIGDTVKGAGPMGGIVSVLEATGASELFVAACDMPFIKAEVVQYILDNRDKGGKLATVAMMDGRPHPLLAVYTSSLLGGMRERLATGRRSLTGMIQDMGAKMLKEEELRRIDPEGLSFANVNTPEDYEKIIARASETGA
ncbi:MAG: molybdenum cofactor guanylyltransferase [Thermodesulfovibrionales bacterium]|nr:molybdenum cofactor guanylyltransferase [Thermodesulfovibrionales bacterium]